LIVGEEPSGRDAMRILLGSMGCECTITSNVQEALATIEQRAFDAVVLDPQSSSAPATEVISRISESHPNLQKRIVLIAEEGGNSEIADLAERYSIPHVQRKFLLQQLYASLESLFRPEAVFQNVRHVARLIFDSFNGAMPAGVRASDVRSRRLLYSSGSLRVDVSVEPRAGSDRMTLAGQILDSAKPDRRFDNIPVALQGRKGSVAHTTATEFGEFDLDFNLEPIVSLEIRITKNQYITVPLSALEADPSKPGMVFIMA
jgi:DNA-binding NtrC family response regulator